MKTQEKTTASQRKNALALNTNKIERTFMKNIALILTLVSLLLAGSAYAQGLGDTAQSLDYDPEATNHMMINQSEALDAIEALLANYAESSNLISEQQLSILSAKQTEYRAFLSQGAGDSSQIITSSEISSAAHARELIELLEQDPEALNQMMMQQPNLMHILIKAANSN